MVQSYISMASNYVALIISFVDYTVEEKRKKENVFIIYNEYRLVHTFIFENKDNNIKLNVIVLYDLS
ncbi:hypothetical protein J2786_000826 [Chryseobacterium vietnamense]|uniref:Uncharacterized protein n=2 Tax=Chryseobacterium TaxID=59732 RepID=A0A543EN51_9FLAO|nr:hypothetical protein [Chryseobacterium vietnamense]TQM23001.1 hypothetical protein FB551_2727 [Chryseobacterium aquifrigidense]